jgi:hypothetical protein
VRRSALVCRSEKCYPMSKGQKKGDFCNFCQLPTNYVVASSHSLLPIRFFGLHARKRRPRQRRRNTAGPRPKTCTELPKDRLSEIQIAPPPPNSDAEGSHMPTTEHSGCCCNFEIHVT